MRTVGVAILGVISAAVVMSAALAALIALVEIRDCWHSRRMIRQMTRSGEPKRTVAPTRPDGVLIVAPSPSWVADDDGNVIDSHGNTWTVTR